jgi:alpha-galactosidase
VNVKKAGDYVMFASVATDNSTAGFTLSVDGESVAEVPVSGESWDDFTEVDAKVKLSEGEHILRFTVTGDWFDIDYIKFCENENCEDPTAISKIMPAVRTGISASRLVKKGNTLFIEKNGKRFDLTGHRIK